MIVRGSLEWITAECPAPPIRTIARAASMPRRASATRMRPSTGNSFSRASGSSGTTRGNGAISTRVRGETRMSASRASVWASRPTRSRRQWPSGKIVVRTRSASSSEQMCAPCLVSSRSSLSAIRSSAISTDSFVQRIELSKAFESTMQRAARGRSAVASTSTGTLPGPTPSAGLPDS